MTKQFQQLRQPPGVLFWYMLDRSLTGVMLVWPIVALSIAAPLFSAEAAYRTDGGDVNLPWFQLKDGEFPPAGSAHHVGGELIGIDYINRKGSFRLDRDGTMSMGDHDLAVPFEMLPYGSCRYHGAPAALADIPLRTHLHGQFYAEVKDGKQVFSKALFLEDDFSYAARLQRLWRVDAVAVDKSTLTVTGIGPADHPVDIKATAFHINSSTRVWKGHEIGALTDAVPGQQVLVNLTQCTLKGPGRCTDIWLDGESRAIATAAQLEAHRLYQREHGLAGWVETIDNKQGFFTVTLFDGIDPKLQEGFQPNGVALSAVAENTLRTYNQQNDQMGGTVLAVESVPVVPGSSGMRITFKPGLLLEGHRPKRIMRFFALGWGVADLPKEERLYQ